MALTFLLAACILPTPVAVILALAARVLLTGALHEDGFADFCDGFGGGTNRERTLAIMKDSHIGTYGVLGLILYYAIIITSLFGICNSSALSCVTTQHHCHNLAVACIMLCGDVFCKWASSHIILCLPYARNEITAKNHLVYADVSKKERIAGFIAGIVPILAATAFLPSLRFVFILSPIVSIASVCLNILFIKKRIQGYTGDCCGATFIVSELIFTITSLAVLNMNICP